MIMRPVLDIISAGHTSTQIWQSVQLWRPISGLEVRDFLKRLAKKSGRISAKFTLIGGGKLKEATFMSSIRSPSIFIRARFVSLILNSIALLSMGTSVGFLPRISTTALSRATLSEEAHRNPVFFGSPLAGPFPSIDTIASITVSLGFR